MEDIPPGTMDEQTSQGTIDGRANESNEPTTNEHPCSAAIAISLLERIKEQLILLGFVVFAVLTIL